MTVRYATVSWVPSESGCPPEIMELFIQVMLYGGCFTTPAAMRIARSVFTEQGISS